MKPILMIIVDISDNPQGLLGKGSEIVLFDGEAAQVPRPGDLVSIDGIERRYIVRGVVWSIETDSLGNQSLRSVRVEVD